VNKLEKLVRDTRLHYTANRRILAVEGSDDVKALEALLDKVNPVWPAQWAVVPVGSKRQAMDLAALKPEGWLILVDKDEWTDGQVTACLGQHANLHILPRFCLESYLVDPTELWATLPADQQGKLAGGVQELAQTLLADLPQWQRHAARWQAINPLWTELRSLGFKESLLRTENFPDDDEVATTLLNWASLLDHHKVLADIHAAQTRFDQLPQTTFLHRHLYAKLFFPQVVVPGLNRLFGQRSEADLRRHFFNDMALPADLLPLWQRMGLLPDEPMSGYS
jgi:hypothetical protein